MQKFLLFLVLVALNYSCSHLQSHDSESLVYSYWGTNIEMIDKKTVENLPFNDYQKQVEISKIIGMNDEDYKTWLAQLSEKFNMGFDDPAMFRYVGRDLYLKASSLEKLGHMEKAEGLFSLVFQRFGATEEALVHYAVLVLKMGDLEKARTSMREAFLLTKDFDRKIDLAQVWLNISEAINDEDKLTHDYTFLMKATVSDSSICARYGRFLNEQKKTTLAIEKLEQCLKENSLANQQEIALELGKIYVGQQHFKKAEKLLDPFKKLKNVDADIVLLLGLLLEQSNKNKDQIQLYTNYMQNGGTDSRILERLADYHFERNNIAQGVNALKILADLQPKNINYKTRLALANLQLNNFSIAINLLLEAKQIDKDNPQINLYLFRAYAAMGKAEEGLEFLKMYNAENNIKQEALTLVGDYFTEIMHSPNYKGNEFLISQWEELLKGFDSLDESMEWNLQKAMLSEVKGDISNAINILESSTNKTDFKEFHAYYLASLYETTKQYDQADKLLNQVVTQNPNFAHAWNFLGYSQLEREGGNLDAAKGYILKALSIDPQSPHFLDSLGWYYYKTGQYPMALKELQRAYSLNGQDVAIGRHLIQVMVVLKLTEQAAELLKRLSQNFPAEDLKDFMQQLHLDRAPASE